MVWCIEGHGAGLLREALSALRAKVPTRLRATSSRNQDALSFSLCFAHTTTMADEELNLYDEIEIEDCFYDETLQIYHHPCPCGDRFEISIADMRDGEDIARCPSCSLMIRIIFDQVCLSSYKTFECSAGTNINVQSDLPPDTDNAPQASAITA